MEIKDIPVILLDICGTLYRSNTTFDFLDYFFSNNTSYRLFCYFFRCKPMKLLNAVIYKLCKFDVIRYCSVKFLSGYTQEKIIEKVHCFYTEVLVQKKQNKVIEILHSDYIQKSRVILVTATLDCIAAHIATIFHINEYYASRLDYRNGICTGKIKNDLLDCKLVHIKENGIKPPFAMTISDNFTDIDLMSASSFSYIISRWKDKNRWKRMLRKKHLPRFEIVMV